MSTHATSAVAGSSNACPPAQRRPRRFRPLDPERAKGSADPVLEGIIFDVDGTLCEPQNYMFSEMRKALSIPKSIDILEHIYTLPSAPDDLQSAAMAKIQAIEREAMAKQVPQPGLADMVAYLEERGVRKGICTRNFDAPVAHLLTTFLPAPTPSSSSSSSTSSLPTRNSHFHPILTRTFRPAKPSPEPLLHIAREWGLANRAESCIMVGDSIDDMEAGYKAGAMTVLLLNAENAALREHEMVDVVIRGLGEVRRLCEGGVGWEGEVSEGVGEEVG